MIKKYAKIYWVFFKNAFSYDAQYRKDTIIKILTNLLWVGMMFTIIEIIFSQTKTINDWSKPEIYLMTVLWIIADEIYVTLFAANIEDISFMIADGRLDENLTKPVAPLFLVSSKKILLRGFYRFLTQMCILGWLIWRFDFAVSWQRVALATLLVGVAVWIDYSRGLIANTFSFWFLRIDNINEAIYSLGGIGKYPISIWPKTFKIMLLTILPVAFSGFVPTATLTGRWPWYGILYAFLFAAFLFWLAIKFWNYALRSYSSASS